jgi:dipeptidyl aminopeptidase/acylaminoacyl peptidase
MHAHDRSRRTALALSLLPLALAATVATLSAQPRLEPRFSIEQVLSPAFPYELISARAADRIAWLEYERGIRNVYTAAAPDFRPVRLTATTDDDGNDLTGVQISADGSIVTFIRGHAPNRDGWVANPMSDPRGADRAVWAVSTRGGPAWRVVRANAYALSPDGRWVLYERGGEIYRATVNPGLTPAAEQDAAPPLFRVYGQSRGAVWAPDGRRIAFVSDRGDHSFIAIYDLDEPRITYLAPGVDRDASPTWSPDGKRVAFLRRPGLPFGAPRPAATPGPGQQQFGQPRARGVPGITEARFRGGHQLELWVADAQTGAGQPVWQHQPNDTTFSNIGRITWADDHVIFSVTPDEWERWYAISLRAPKPQPVLLTPDDGFIEYTALSSDGRHLYYASGYGDIDRRDLWRVRVAGGRPERLTRGEGIETIPAVLASERQVAVLYADAKRPLSVALIDAGGGSARVITPLPPAYPHAQHVVPQNVELTAADGLKTNNQLFLPPDLRRGERRPALIFIHGGPARQMLLGYHYRHFYHMAYALNQYFANKGYIVLSVNYRSGIGYGRSFRSAQNTGRRGNAEYADILAAGTYLRERPDVDVSRIGVWGLSYGGILTAQALARNSDIFAAGVDMAGVHLWGDALDTASVAYRSSAISAIDTWKSPVLLLHGDDDRNVAFSQTVGLVQLLREHDVPFELIVYPDDVHDSLLFHRWIQAFRATDDFFERAMIRKEPVRVQ